MGIEQILSRFIYYPDPDLIAEPAHFGMQAEEIWIVPEAGVQLHAWFFPRPEPVASLLFCHGNAGNISHRLTNVQGLVQVGFQVLLFDYRGYGHSSGQLSEGGLYRDAAAAWRHLVERPDTAGTPRIIFGRSLGGAVAVDLASHVSASGLILESTFTSLRTLIRHIYHLPLPELPIRYDSLSKIRQLKMPLLAIHGEQDELIPFADGRALFDAAPEPKAWYPIPGAGHNDTFMVGRAAYFRRLEAFARSL